MPLSPHEESVLAALEAALRADDPALADALSTDPWPPVVPVRAVTPTEPPPAPPVGAVTRTPSGAATALGGVVLVVVPFLLILLGLPPVAEVLLASAFLFVGVPWFALRMLAHAERTRPA